MILKRFLCFVTAMSLATTISAQGAQIQTPAPVIYLKSNAGEPQNLGWCLDTVGRGFSDRIHIHSCKPQGGDVQFIYDPATQQLQSAEFDGYCISLGGTADVPEFHLVTCEAGVAEQSFVYSEQDLTLHPADADMQCLVAAEQVTSAGPFHSRALQLSPCDAAAAELKEWVILSN